MYASQPTREPEWNAGCPDTRNLAVVSEGIQVIRPLFKVPLDLKAEMEICWESLDAPDNGGLCCSPFCVSVLLKTSW